MRHWQLKCNGTSSSNIDFDLEDLDDTEVDGGGTDSDSDVASGPWDAVSSESSFCTDCRYQQPQPTGGIRFQLEGTAAFRAYYCVYTCRLYESD
jgi:hypothetical protein